MKELKDVAISYIGQKEIKNNMGFKSNVFDKIMRKVGFYNGAPWCSYFVKACIREFYGEKSSIYLNVNGSALTSYEKLEDKGFLTGAIPKPNSIAVWRHYKNGRPVGRNGHIGIVVTGLQSDQRFETVEGNTNASGGREGDEVAKKLRSLNWLENNGLRLIGFVYL